MQQRQPIESSIIIPVFNQWDLTRNCLIALRETLRGKSCEVIVVDNASSDATKSLCQALGKELLGENFHYYRSETNLNFGPASNLGAQKATGEFLIFLNNDTIPTPGWYTPLIEDFTTYPDIAATGPVLVYPEKGPLGRTIQHLGVYFTPTFSVGHLYEGIPETSPLAKKRRFFQVITAACLVIRRELFMGIGMFDEEYVNGCEDIDLCARLSNKGYRMTINPEAKVIHLTSQTPGRFNNDAANFALLAKKIHNMVKPDWHLLLEKDEVFVHLTPWLQTVASYPPEQVENLNQTLNSATSKSLQELLIKFPLWQEGYETLISLLEKEKVDTTLLDISHDKLFRDRKKLLQVYMEAFKTADPTCQFELAEMFDSLCPPYETLISQAQAGRFTHKQKKLEASAKQYTHWLDNQQFFRDNYYFPALYALYEAYAHSQKQKPIPYASYIAGDYAKSNAISARFDDTYYKKQYPFFFNSSFPAFMHYILVGKAEGALHNKPKAVLADYTGSYQPVQDVAFTDDSCRLVAWYLPQFHPIPENNCAWGTGFTEWTNVTAAKPRFEGHYQPRLPGVLGFYDLRRKETLEEQIALAKHAGIYGFCMHHYWFHGQTIMRTPLEHFKNNPSLDFPFCLHWANEPWTRRWDGSNEDVIIDQQYSPADDLAFIEDIDWALRDKRYMKFQCKPMLGIYRPDLFPNIAKSVELWRDYCRTKGIGEIFLFASLAFSSTAEQHTDFGFDASVEYPPHKIATPRVNYEYVEKGLDYFGFIRSYKNARNYFLDITNTDYSTPVFRGVMPGWDNTARSYDAGQLYAEATPQTYGEWLDIAVNRAKNDSYAGEKHVFINAWNEWAECAYLEPDARYGASVLNTTARTIEKKNSLPHVLFICNTDNKDLAAWLEEILTDNKANPQFQPVVLTPLPVMSIETFKGLSPLIPSFSTADKRTIQHLLGRAGYFSFELAIILQGNDLPYAFTEGVFEVSQHIIACPQTNNQTAVPAYSTDNMWLAQNTHMPLPEWQLTNIITKKESTAGILLRRSQQASGANMDVTVIILPANNNELNAQNLIFAEQYTPLSMEILVPDTYTAAFRPTFPHIREFTSTQGDLSYLHAALSEAQADVIWLLDLSEPSSAQVAQVLFLPFIDKNIVAARPYFGKEEDCLPQLFEKNTLAFSGKEILAMAEKKGKKALPQISQSLFRRDSLLRALDQCCLSNGQNQPPITDSASLDRDSLVGAVYALGHVAVVPSRLE